ncbi:hypothetical protein QN413_26985, partial [Variovorax sp. LG9.2]|nr:hypothetical protein [Variovorax sp. LG9.2]
FTGEVLASSSSFHTYRIVQISGASSARRVLDLLTWLRGTWNSSMPVMVLSERSGARDVARALDGVANDYVIKPFRSLELHARAYRF